MSENVMPQRIAPLEPPYTDDLSAAFARVMPPGIAPLRLFRTMARSPRVLQRMFAGNLLDKGSISLRDREIVILRTCFRCGSEYEWGVHVAFFAERAGIDKDGIASTLMPRIGVERQSRDALLMALVDALHVDATIGDELWMRLEREFTEEQLLELIALTGYYHTISFLTNALCVGNESYAARFSDYGNA